MYSDINLTETHLINSSSLITFLIIGLRFTKLLIYLSQPVLVESVKYSELTFDIDDIILLSVKLQDL